MSGQAVPPKSGAIRAGLALALCVVGAVLPSGMLAARAAPAGRAAASQEIPVVRFRIASDAPAKGSKKGTRAWLATYTRKKKVARFRIELEGGGTKGDNPITFQQGAFVRVPHSDQSQLLPALKTALEAKHLPKNVKKADRLLFGVAVLGVNQSGGNGEGFSSEPPGHWIAAKVFVAEGEGEFFLNLNPVDGIGEITAKDSDYGDIVLRELARVF